MRAVIMSLIVFVNFIMESTVLRYVEIRSVKPNMTIALVVSYSILRGSVEGAMVGLAAGLFQDVFFGTSIGYYALIYMTIGAICGLPTETFFKDNFILPLVFCIFCMLLNGFFIYVTGFLIRRHLEFSYFLSNIILPETVYTAAVCFFVYRLIFSVNKRLEEYEHEKRKVF